MYLQRKNWEISLTNEILEKEQKMIYTFNLKWKTQKFIDYDNWKFLPLVKKFIENFHLRLFTLKEKIWMVWIWIVIFIMIIYWYFFYKTIKINEQFNKEISAIREKTQNINNIDIKKMNIVNEKLMEKLWIWTWDIEKAWTSRLTSEQIEQIKNELK